jgi:hypothetical protein
LIRKNTCLRRYGVFKVRALPRSRALPANAGAAGLSKLNSVRISHVEVDVLLGELSDRTAEAIDG